jgi:amphi-Trp domain-containing protein
VADRDVTATYPVADFVAKLRRLADALEAGKPFRIQIAGERFTVPGRAECSVEHEREGGEEEVELQLRWTTADADDADVAGDDV